MCKPYITSLTLSAEISDKEYGNGTKAFMNLSGRWPEPGKPIEEIDDVVQEGLDLYFAAWKTMLASRYSTGAIDGKTLKEHLSAAETRLARVREFIRKDKQAVPANE
jgi:hypothetical protein